MTLFADGTHPEGITPEDYVSDRIRCLECGAFKDETPGEWLVEHGIIECPDCRSDTGEL